MASTYLSRSTNSGSTGTKWTLSAWVKRAGTGENNCIWNQSNDSNSTTYNEVAIKSGNELDVQIRNGTSGDNGTYIRRRTSRLFRDCNAFYHIVVRYDSTNGTAGDRLRLYVNGVQETSMQESVGTVPQNQVTVMATSGADQTFGRGVGSSTHYWNGVISHAHLCDGYSYAPSEFGETDSTTGEWKIKTSPSVSYGTNGWFILKDGNSVTDQSGQSNNWSVTAGTLTFTHDNPSNNFATLNAISGVSHPTLEHGNNSVSNSASDGNRVYGSVPSKAGYYEVKLGLDPDGSSGKGFEWGVFDATNYSESTYSVNSARVMKTNYAYDTHFSTQNWGGGNSWENVTTGLDADAGDILMCAWKNGKVYFGYNGTWFFSANPSNNTDGSTQLPLADSNAYQMAVGKSHVAGMGDVQFNFGNGYFGTTAITTNSGNGYADANGQGKFQYQVPTGCYALCTKNLNV